MRDADAECAMPIRDADAEGPSLDAERSTDRPPGRLRY
jgi:hypothetical protein